MGPLVQVVGALLVLTGFALAQAKLLTPQARATSSRTPSGLPSSPSDAYIERQWGFLLLEGVWAAISIWGLIGLARRAACPS